MRFLNEEGLQRLWGHIGDALGKKVDKIEGKDLSTEDFTAEEKEKLAELADISQKTAEGGIVLSDYENNVAGIKGCMLSDYHSKESNTIIYLLGNTTAAEFPYAVGDILNCDNGFHLVKRFEITDIHEAYSSEDDETPDLMLTIEDIGDPGEFKYRGMDGVVEDMNMDSNCYFSCPDKPLAGDIIIPEKENAIAAGEQAKALGRASFVAGRNNAALQDCGVALGRNNTAGYCGTALGRGNNALGEYATALGYGTNASGDITLATGQGSHANKKTAAAFNYYTKANGIGAAAFGNQTNSYGDYTFTQGVGTAAGWGNKVPGQAAFGQWNKEDQTALFMIGNGTGSGDARKNAFVVHTDGRATVGAEPVNDFDVVNKKYFDNSQLVVTSTAENSRILTGSSTNLNEVKSKNGVIAGFNNIIQDNAIAGFIAGGQRNEIKGQNAFASGYKNKVYGNGAVAFGDTNTVGQVTIGSDNMATSFDKSANYSAVFGFNNKAQYANQFVIGKYNDNQSTNLFEVGNGSSATRGNAFAIDTSGHAILGASPTEDMHATTKEYVDNVISNSGDCIVYLSKEEANYNTIKAELDSGKEVIITYENRYYQLQGVNDDSIMFRSVLGESDAYILDFNSYGDVYDGCFPVLTWNSVSHNYYPSDAAPISGQGVAEALATINSNNVVCLPIDEVNYELIEEYCNAGKSIIINRYGDYYHLIQTEGSHGLFYSTSGEYYSYIDYLPDGTVEYYDSPILLNEDDVQQNYDVNSDKPISGQGVAEAISTKANQSDVATLQAQVGNTPVSEQITEAVDNITKIREQNKNVAMGIWVGTIDEYNALENEPNNTLVFKTDSGNSEISQVNGIVDIDQTYNPESTNPQSGLAVSEAMANKELKFIKKITLEESVAKISTTFDKPLKELWVRFMGNLDGITATVRDVVLAARGTNGGAQYFFWVNSLVFGATTGTLNAYTFRTKEILPYHWETEYDLGVINNLTYHEDIEGVPIQGLSAHSTSTKKSHSTRLPEHIPKRYIEYMDFFEFNGKYSFAAGSTIEIWGIEAEVNE